MPAGMGGSGRRPQVDLPPSNLEKPKRRRGRPRKNPAPQIPDTPGTDATPVPVAPAPVAIAKKPEDWSGILIDVPTTDMASQYRRDMAAMKFLKAINDNLVALLNKKG